MVDHQFAAVGGKGPQICIINVAGGKFFAAGVKKRLQLFHGNFVKVLLRVTRDPPGPDICKRERLGPFFEQGIVKPADGDDFVPVFLPRLKTEPIGRAVLTPGTFPYFPHDFGIGLGNDARFAFLTDQSKGVKFHRMLLQTIIGVRAAYGSLQGIGKVFQLFGVQRIPVGTHHRLWPEAADDEFCPVNGWAAGPNSVIVLRELLRFRHALPPAAASAVHVGVLYGTVMENLSHSLAEYRHIVGTSGTPVFNSVPVDFAGLLILPPVITVSLVAGVGDGCGEAVDESVGNRPAPAHIIGHGNVAVAAGAAAAPRRPGKAVIPGKGAPDDDVFLCRPGFVIDNYMTEGRQALQVGFCPQKLYQNINIAFVFTCVVDLRPGDCELFAGKSGLQRFGQIVRIAAPADTRGFRQSGGIKKMNIVFFQHHNSSIQCAAASTQPHSGVALPRPNPCPPVFASKMRHFSPSAIFMPSPSFFETVGSSNARARKQDG